MKGSSKGGKMLTPAKTNDTRVRKSAGGMAFDGSHLSSGSSRAAVPPLVTVLDYAGMAPNATGVSQTFLRQVLAIAGGMRDHTDERWAETQWWPGYTDELLDRLNAHMPFSELAYARDGLYRYEGNDQFTSYIQSEAGLTGPAETFAEISRQVGLKVKFLMMCVDISEIYHSQRSFGATGIGPDHKEDAGVRQGLDRTPMELLYERLLTMFDPVELGVPVNQRQHYTLADMAFESLNHLFPGQRGADDVPSWTMPSGKYLDSKAYLEGFESISAGYTQDTDGNVRYVIPWMLDPDNNADQLLRVRGATSLSNTMVEDGQLGMRSVDLLQARDALDSVSTAFDLPHQAPTSGLEIDITFVDSTGATVRFNDTGSTDDSLRLRHTINGRSMWTFDPSTGSFTISEGLQGLVTAPAPRTIHFANPQLLHYFIVSQSTGFSVVLGDVAISGSPMGGAPPSVGQVTNNDGNWLMTDEAWNMLQGADIEFSGGTRSIHSQTDRPGCVQLWQLSAPKLFAWVDFVQRSLPPGYFEIHKAGLMDGMSYSSCVGPNWGIVCDLENVVSGYRMNYNPINNIDANNGPFWSDDADHQAKWDSDSIEKVVPGFQSRYDWADRIYRGITVPMATSHGSHSVSALLATLPSRAFSYWLTGSERSLDKSERNVILRANVASPESIKWSGTMEGRSAYNWVFLARWQYWYPRHVNLKPATDVLFYNASGLRGKDVAVTFTNSVYTASQRPELQLGFPIEMGGSFIDDTAVTNSGNGSEAKYKRIVYGQRSPEVRLLGSLGIVQGAVVKGSEADIYASSASGNSSTFKYDGKTLNRVIIKSNAGPAYTGPLSSGDTTSFTLVGSLDTVAKREAAANAVAYPDIYTEYTHQARLLMSIGGAQVTSGFVNGTYVTLALGTHRNGGSAATPTYAQLASFNVNGAVVNLQSHFASQADYDGLVATIKKTKNHALGLYVAVSANHYFGAQPIDVGGSICDLSQNDGMISYLFVSSAESYHASSRSGATPGPIAYDATAFSSFETRFKKIATATSGTANTLQLNNATAYTDGTPQSSVFDAACYLIHPDNVTYKWHPKYDLFDAAVMHWSGMRFYLRDQSSLGNSRLLLPYHGSGQPFARAHIPDYLVQSDRLAMSPFLVADPNRVRVVKVKYSASDLKADAETTRMILGNTHFAAVNRDALLRVQNQVLAQRQAR